MMAKSLWNDPDWSNAAFRRAWRSALARALQVPSTAIDDWTLEQAALDLMGYRAALARPVAVEGA